MECKNVYQDYFNLARQILENMHQSESPDVWFAFVTTEHCGTGEENLPDINPDSPMDIRCPLPYAKNWRSSPPLQKDKSPAENRQDQGAVDKGQDNPQRPVPLVNEKVCVLCRKNLQVYRTHTLTDDRGKITCPVLRKHICRVCGATGDNAHTIRHCPTINRNRPAYHNHRQYQIYWHKPRYFYH